MEDYGFFYDIEEECIIHDKYSNDYEYKYYDGNYESFNDDENDIMNEIDTCNNKINCCKLSTMCVMFVYWFSL